MLGIEVNWDTIIKKQNGKGRQASCLKKWNSYFVDVYNAPFYTIHTIFYPILQLNIYKGFVAILDRNQTNITNKYGVTEFNLQWGCQKVISLQVQRQAWLDGPLHQPMTVEALLST